MIQHTHNPLVFFSFGSIDTYAMITHGAFTRLGGVSHSPFDSLNTSYSTGDEEQAVTSNLRLVCSALEISAQDLIMCNLEHGDKVLLVTKALKQQLTQPGRASWPLADSMITNEPGCFLTMSSADCAMVLLLDPVKVIVGLVHAGWKGIVKEVSKKTILAMQQHFDSSPSDILVGVAPSIGPCCYRINNPMQKTLPGWSPYLQDSEDGRTAIDLRQALHDQLVEGGIKEENIEVDKTCTSCNTSLFFSFWAEKPKTGRMAVVIGIRNERSSAT